MSEESFNNRLATGKLFVRKRLRSWFMMTCGKEPVVELCECCYLFGNKFTKKGRCANKFHKNI